MNADPESRFSHRDDRSPDAADASRSAQEAASTLKALAIVLGAAALLVIVFGGFMVKFAYDEYEISRWPTTEGTLVAASGRKNQAVLRRGGEDPTAQLELRYSYQVNDTHYSGTKLAPGQANVAGLKVEDVPQRFRVGTKKPVIYNPANPAESYWENNFDEAKIWKSWCIVVPGVALLPVSGLLFHKARRAALKRVPGEGNDTEPGDRHERRSL